MIKEAINRIAEMAIEADGIEPIKFEGDDRQFVAGVISPVPPARPKALHLSTLSGLIDWWDSGDADGLDDLIVHIEDHRTVAVRSGRDRAWKERDCYVIAEVPECEFPFDRMMEIEKFIINLQLNFEASEEKTALLAFVINLQLNFEASEEKTALLAFVSSISRNEIHAAEDDGISQSTIAKDEIGRLSDVTINPIQKLRPFRTFREIDQPVGEFLLRLSRGSGELPLVALFTAQGLAWKLDAANKIHAYLVEHLEGATIIR